MGPEDTKDQLQFKYKLRHLKQSKIKDELIDQMNQKYLTERESGEADRVHDLRVADAIHKRQLDEDKAIV